jgi:hypothetical protein
VIRCCDHDNVAWHLVDLEKKRRDHALDLASLVLVPALLGQGIELVKEEHALPRARGFKDLGQSGRRLAKVAPYDLVVADHEQGNQQGFSSCLSE